MECIGVLVPSKSDSAATELSDDVIAKADQDHVLSVIRIAVRDGQRISTARAGTDTVIHGLESYKEHPRKYHSKSGRKRVKAALVELEREKRITRVSYKDGSRNTKEAWEPSELTQSESVSGEILTKNLRQSYTPHTPMRN